MATSIFAGINLHNKQLQETHPEFVEFANTAIDVCSYFVKLDEVAELAKTALTKQLIEFVKSINNFDFYVEATTEGPQLCVVWTPSHEYYCTAEQGAAVMLNTSELFDSVRWLKCKMGDDDYELYSALDCAIGVHMLDVS